MVQGVDVTTGTSSETISSLKGAAVPISLADCRACPDPCDDDDHEDWKFDVDMETYMLGLKPYRRQVVISTGKSDWQKEVTEASGTLAAYLSEAATQAPEPSKEAQAQARHTAAQPKAKAINGIFSAADSTRTAILNGSHRTLSHDHELDTVLVFPDYRVVTEVPQSLAGAKSFWKTAVDPAVEWDFDTTLKTWILPYSCVILLCSHKKRDNRCSIAAPKLEQAFTHSLESHDWEVHTQLEDLEHAVGPPLEAFSGTQEEKDADILAQLKALPGHQRALILRNSHIGGHKFSGNAIIYTPQGSGVWYGRVTTHDVESIVQHTIIGGEILPPLLRGGVNLARPGCKTLNDW
ncbi:hypothetical protein FIBSPDRAFT_168518 [Athelia psychrophila]|uniref:Sucraseferredoxin-like protein n=1 Tax=Athelia psychrophila TaxID=1759441 RepID=A0A166AZ56_9AGAM|nr:hypothetical protein FIBSPDRAFT_168518 [Fibularhizoctonia sp. CBS 109695]